MSESACPLIESRDVRKSFALGHRSLEVLQGISLRIFPGEFLALQGASGAGKSTLLHLLGGLDVPSAGEIRFDGKLLSRLSRRQLALLRGRSIGFVFQSYLLLPELDALENVCLPARMARVSAAESESRGRAYLERVGLRDRMDHKPYELSGGEQQRVAIARALINSPDLILADEPTGNLDSHTGQEIIDLLCSLQAESGKTLVVATHDAHVAVRARRVLHLVDGQILENGAPSPVPDGLI